MNGVVVVTDRRQAADAGHELVDVVAAAVDGGAAGVLLREKDLPRDERASLAAALRDVTASSGADLVVASDGELARSSGADGVHLAAADPWPGDPWPDDIHTRIGVSRSCHTIDDLVGAERHHAAWATFSPVFVTSSKPGYGPALGLAGLTAGCRAAPSLPVLALGGVDVDNAGRCVGGGATGVAVMGAVMRASDPRAVVRALVDVVARRDAPHQGVAR